MSIQLSPSPISSCNWVLYLFWYCSINLLCYLQLIGPIFCTRLTPAFNFSLILVLKITSACVKGVAISLYIRSCVVLITKRSLSNNFSAKRKKIYIFESNSFEPRLLKLKTSISYMKTFKVIFFFRNPCLFLCFKNVFKKN
jgi:hypothetical protein